jgi:HlyD family secretion protein
MSRLKPSRRAFAPGLAVLLCAAACGEWGKPGNPDGEDTGKEAPLVRVAPLRRVTLDRVLEISGSVEAMTYVTVNPRIEDAEILELRADVGDRVEAGAVLAVFDSTDANMILEDAKLAEAEAAVQLKDAEVSLKELLSQTRAQQQTLDQAQRSLDRAKAQAEKGAIAQEALDAVQHKRDLELAQKERLAIQIEKAGVMVELAKKSQEKAALSLSRAERKVSWANLRAPIAGIVAKRQATIGQQTLFTSLARGALFEIFDPASLVVNAMVTQRDLPHLRVGQPVEIRSDACPDVTFAGAVTIISPIIDTAAGTVPLRIAIEGRERLKPGMFASGRIVLEARPNTLVVPKKAVLYERERPYVMKIGGTAEQPAVSRILFREGLAGKEDVEAVVENGELSDSDRIVLVGHDRLRDGDRVVIEGAAAASREGAASKAAAPANGG